MKKSVLGKGLEALLPSDESFTEGDTKLISIDKIKPNIFQPRKNFDQASLTELANSIKEKGVLQPLLARKKGRDYEIIAGERRWRAAHQAGLKDVPVIIKDISDNVALEFALIENLQREDLNPLEEAEAYEQLINEFGLKHEEISDRIGKDRSTITNQLRLLKLTDKAKIALIGGEISAGHARALLSLETQSSISRVLKEIINKKLSVRQTEKLIKSIVEKVKKKPNTKRIDSAVNPYINQVSDELIKHFSTKVKISGKDSKGKIEIEYYSVEEFERLVGMLLSNG